MLELDALDGPYIHTRQVAWIGDGPKYVYKRDTITQSWVRASNGDWQAQFSTFQTLRRQGYCLVHKDGSPVLDTDGTVMGAEPLPPAKSDTPTMEAMEVALHKLKDLDLDSVPEGEEPITRLLSLNDRMALIRFKDTLQELPRETLLGYAMQAVIKVRGGVPASQGAEAYTQVIRSMWGLIDDPAALGKVILELGNCDKATLLSILKSLLPEVMRLEGLKGSITARGKGAPQ